MTVNRLILGDNLEILKSMDKESVDLIYLDPPFFSNRNYEVIWGDTGEIRSFQDRWATFGSIGRHKPLHRMAKRKGRGNAPCTKAHRKHFSTLRLTRR
jgi:DNA modification methylase